MQEINGDPALVAIERAIHELRCGRVIGCCRSGPFDTSQAGDVLVASAETASAALIARSEELAGEHGLALAITRERADTLGVRAPDGYGNEDGALLLRLHRPVSPSVVSWLAGIDVSESISLCDACELSAESGDALVGAALKLAKGARLLPAVLVIPSTSLAEEDVLYVSTAQLEHLEYSGPLELERVSEARVPLAGHEDCRLVLFRDGRDSSEHVAVLIGSPQGAVVPVRLHSACLTGDLLASLRCDCGDQLRSGVDQLAAVGGGVLLYLAQEGRGIGLANKLRAYQLQDAGLDTIEADRHLGFRADERSYAAAASMLRHLGMTRIRLLTNNLDKIEALRKEGIDVVGGQRLIGAVNRHNARYVHAKRERAGHLMPEIDMDGLL